ncbi:MAG: AAA family ATPase [Candidatus Acidiferrum sp.]
MFEHLFTHFGLRENPFHVSPDPRFYFSTNAHDAALAELVFGAETRQGLIILTGEAGTGKTTVLNHFLNYLQEKRQSSCYVFHSQLKPAELFEFILRDFGVPCDTRNKGDLLDALHQWLIARHTVGDSPVLIIDEAQAISVRTLDQLRLLLNLETPGSKLLTIVLAGQPELEEKLRRPELRQLHQRVMFRCSLLPLSLDETVRYVKSRLVNGGATAADAFSQESLEAMYVYARGLPRIVNLLCEHSLIAGYAAQVKVITPDIVRRVATDFDLTSQPAGLEERELNPRFGRLVPFSFQERISRVEAEAASKEFAEDVPERSVTPASVTSPVVQAPAAQIEPIVAAVKAEPAFEHPAAMVPKPMVAAAAAAAGAAAAGAVGVGKPSNVGNSQLAQTSAQKAFSAAPPKTVTNQVVALNKKMASRTVQLPPKRWPTQPKQQQQQKPAPTPQRKPGWTAQFMAYWKDVKDSFVRDWKQFLGAHGATKPSGANATSLQRNVIVPITKWLREPAAASARRAKNRPAPATARKQG